MPRRNFPPARPTRLYQSYPLEAAGGGGGSGADLSDYYTKTDVDNLFGKKAGTETISGLWTFTAKASFDQGTLAGFAPNFARNIEALYDSSLSSGNDLSILGMLNQTVATTGGPQGIEGYVVATHPSGTINTMIGTVGNAEHAGAGTVSDMRGHTATVGNSSTGVTTAAKGIHIASGFKTSTGSITTLYGLFIDDQLVGDTDYAIWTKSGMVSFGDDLYLRDATTYPTDSLLYRTSTGQVVGTGASAQGDLIYNIDGDAWTPLAIGTSGYVLTVGGAGVPEWAANVAADTALFDGQLPSYYLNRTNHTGTELVTNIELLPEGNVIIGGASANTYRALTLSDIAADSGSPADYIFNGDIQFITSYATASGYNYPFYSEATQTFASTQGTVGGAFYAQATHTSGTVLAMLGLEAYVAAQAAGGTITHAYGIYVWGGSENATSVITNFYGLYLETPDVTGTITNKYGLYANNYGTGGYPIYTNQGIVSIGGFLELRDSTQYPVDSVLYVGSGGTIEGSGAAATGDLLFNIDGSAWTSLAIGTEGYVLKVVSGLPTWSTNSATDADTLDGQHGTYYLSRSNHTGTQAVTTLTAGPDDTFLQVRTGVVQFGTLDAADIEAGTFPGASYTFTSNLTVSGKLTVDNDIFLSNGSNGAIKYDGTMVEFVPTSGDGAVGGGWARGLEWNGGGASVNAAQVGTLGSADSITYIYISADGTSGTSDYNSANTWRWLSGGAGVMYMGGTQPEVRFYESDAGTNEKYWRLYAANGVFALSTMTDALGGTNSVFTITRTGAGTTPDYMNWRVHDIRIEADGNDAQYHRWYANSNTGTTSLEFRRTSDSAMAHRFQSQASTGDFYFSWYNWSTLQHHWFFVDASASIFYTDGVWEWQGALHGHIYDNGTIASGATLNVDWDNGNSQRCAASAGNITIDVDGASMRQGTAYTIQVINISTTASRTVTWSGVDSWVGGTSPTAAIQQSYGTTVVQLYVARAQAGTDYVIGSVILDNTITPS